MKIGKNQILALIIVGSLMGLIQILDIYTLSNNNTLISEKEIINLPKSAEPHGPIMIDGNAELDAFCAGNGTLGTSWATAHVIKDYDIDAGEIGGAIVLRNIDRYLVIQNCTAVNSGTLVWDLDAGIELDNCANVNITM